MIVVRSTVPMGFTSSMLDKYKKMNIIFMPEFLREGKALYDSMHPSRVIIGRKKQTKKIEEFVKVFYEALNDKKAPLLFMNSNEAEVVKLFSNTYLAMRVAFFNELDSFANEKKLDALDIINGVCEDERIGNFYNNPSFGYGGYCLPKDTKQLLAQYQKVPNCLIKAIVESNIVRKKYLAQNIVDTCVKNKIRNKKVVLGVFRLLSKKETDNCRNSATCELLNEIHTNTNYNIIIYEPTLDHYEDYEIVKQLDVFIKKADIIIANRYDECLASVNSKVFTRDLKGCN